MIKVTLAANGDILLRCGKCGDSTAVKKSWAASPFWEILVGQALLVLLGHVEKEHA